MMEDKMLKFVSVLLGALLLFPVVGECAFIGLGGSIDVAVGEVVDLPPIVVRAEMPGEIVAGGPVWIILPDGFVFDDSVSTFVASSEKVAGVASYAYSGKLFFLPVTQDFAPGEEVEIRGLRVKAVKPVARSALEVDVNNDFIGDAATPALLEAK
jgi:hypothetical protein